MSLITPHQKKSYENGGGCFKRIFRDYGHTPNESDHAASSWEENSVSSARLGGEASSDDISANGGRGRGVAPSVMDADGVPQGITFEGGPELCRRFPAWK